MTLSEKKTPKTLTKQLRLNVSVNLRFAILPDSLI